MFHYMTRSSRWIFRKSSQPAVQGYYHLYISIQLRNLGTIYWVQWCSQEVGVWGKPCLMIWSSTPLLEEGLLNMLEEWIEGAARTKGAKRPRIEGEAWDWAGKGSGEGAQWAPPQKNFENSYFKPCILVSSVSWSENLYFPQRIWEFSGEGLGPGFRSVFAWERCKTTSDGSRMKPQLYTNDFDTFQSNAYFGVEESPFFKNMYVMVQINPHSPSRSPDMKWGFNCVVAPLYMLSWTAHSRSKIDYSW